MNVCQLVDELKHAAEVNGPFAEVVIVTKNDQRYFIFTVNERTRLVATKGDTDTTIITLEVTDKVSRYIENVEE
jgi:hypothetical protein